MCWRPEGESPSSSLRCRARPVVRSVYCCYSTHMLPWIGRMLSRNHEAYGYLPASIEAFASPDELLKLLRLRGFVTVTARPLTFGIVYLYTACRG